SLDVVSSRRLTKNLHRDRDTHFSLLVDPAERSVAADGVRRETTHRILRDATDLRKGLVGTNLVGVGVLRERHKHVGWAAESWIVWVAYKPAAVAFSVVAGHLVAA